MSCDDCSEELLPLAALSDENTTVCQFDYGRLTYVYAEAAMRSQSDYEKVQAYPIKNRGNSINHT